MGPPPMLPHGYCGNLSFNADGVERVMKSTEFSASPLCRMLVLCVARVNMRSVAACRKQDYVEVLRRTARDEVRVLIVCFAIGEFAAIESRHCAAGAEYHRMSGGCIPFHRAPESRIEIGDAFRHLAELQ